MARARGEDGKITRPVRDVRFTDSVLDILARTDALTSDVRLVSEGERFASGSVVPAAALDVARER